jgi:serpin B
MHLTRDCFYLDAGRAQVLQLPYAGRGLSLQIILPKGDLDLLESNLSAGDLSAWTQGLKIRSVRVSLPKFSVSTRMALTEALTGLGMKDAFGPAADFSGMAAGSALSLATVMHQANLVVDEGGQSAPKAALPQSKDDKSAVDFKANHPFLFLVRHAASGEIVLMGRINDPNQP